MRSLRSPLSVTVAAVAAALVLASCGSDESTEDATPSTTTSTPADDSADEGTEDPAEEEAPEEEPAAGKTIEVTIDGDSISPNGAEMSLSVGDELVLEITSDRAGELHVHARPEAYVQFGPGRTTERIVFENPGTVEIEEHDAHFVVAVIQVR